MRTCVRWLPVLLFLLFTATTSHAQLTAEDIAELHEQGIREGWTFTVGENPATQYSIDQLTGLRIPDELPVPPSTGVRLARSILPTAYDWRDVTGPLPVRNQGGCGSCWAFSTIGALEWGILIWDRDIIDLSEQWLVSCDEGSFGCGGGWLAFDFFLAETDPCGHCGAVLEADFPYAASNLPCACPYPHHYFIETWGEAIDVGGAFEIDEIKQAIMTYGPVSCYVSVTPAFQAYNSGVFNACDGAGLNHAVVLIGWDDAQGSDGVWIMRNSWGSGWGENGHMRIEYDCSMIGTDASYLVYTGPQYPGLNFDYPAGIPDTIAPYEATPFVVDLSGRYNGIPVPNTGRLHYTINHGPVEISPMTEIAPAQYEAVLPYVACDDTLEFYVSAEEQTSGRLYDPNPASPLTVAINSDETPILKDNFLSGLGWTVNGDAAEGRWQRGVPLGHGDRCDPMHDFDGSGCCYLTGNADGDSDVEGGSTYLESPVFDLSSGDARIRYARWFCNEFDGQTADDVFIVELSDNNGGTWNPVETVGPDGASGGWITHEFWASAYAELTDQMKVRFTASDLGESSIVEAAVDAVSITRYACYECDCAGHCDLNLDGTINPVDVVLLVGFVYKCLDSRLQLLSFCPGENGDWNCDGLVNPVDVVYYVNFVYKSSGDEPDDPCMR